MKNTEINQKKKWENYILKIIYKCNLQKEDKDKGELIIYKFNFDK